MAISLKPEPCSNTVLPASSILLLTQIFNITLQKCQMDDFDHYDFLNRLNVLVEDANKCWFDTLSNNINSQSRILIKTLQTDNENKDSMIKDLQYQLTQEKLYSSEIQKKLIDEQGKALKLEMQKNVKQEECNRHIKKSQQDFWKFTSQKAAGDALFEAAKTGDASLTNWLLNMETPASPLDENSDTPLHKAAEAGYSDVVSILLKHGTLINAKDKWKWTPLHYCAWRGHYDACANLLEEGATINPVTHDGRTPLHRSAEEGFLKVSKLLIKYGANVGSRDNWEWTPLFYAAWKGHLETCQLLIDNGAQINARSTKKDWSGTALTWATKNNHYPVVQFLKENGGK